ncbi:hypothetical protein BJ742DRAFT_512482 [Cladochytrium replicatum]|nr:hypothetical protein BJ742DRAFT_512482 [Cladochytrium replicatum]
MDVFLSHMQLIPTKKNSYLTGQDLTGALTPEQDESIKAAPHTDQLWQVGVTARSVSVSEAGVLRSIQFTPKGTLPTSDDVLSALAAAILTPIEDVMLPAPLPVIKPRKVGFLQTRQCPDQVITSLHNLLEKKGYEIAAGKLEELEAEVAESRKKVLEEEAAVRKAATKVEFIPTPKRVCFVCSKEIAEKPSQCSVCKAVIYCSADCAKKNWTQHKQLCPSFKACMKRLEAPDSMHDFPFTFYNSKQNQLQSFNAVNFLSRNELHNVGLFRRFCHCFDNVPFGELAFQLQKQIPEGGKELFDTLGLAQDMYPLSKALKLKDGEEPAKAVTSWKSYFDAAGIPFDSPSALVLESPLTVFHLLTKYYLPSLKADANSRKITLHMVSATTEADIVHIYETLLPLLPNTDLTINMFGPAITPNAPLANPATFTFSNSNSTIKITYTNGIYASEILEGKQTPYEKPDVVLCLNAGLLGPGGQYVPLRLFYERGVKLLVTEPMEQSIHILAGQLAKAANVILSVPPTPNPFRQPVFQFNGNVNLPSWSNGFIFGFH